MRRISGWLVDMAGSARIGDGGGPVVGVVGGSGGVGASTFAAVLALRAGAVLLDLDVTGGGVDVLLGLEAEPGARWSGLQLAGGHLDPAAVRAGLPQVGRCAVLAADVAELDPEAVDQVLGAAAVTGPVVVDLPRAGCAERAAALLRCDLVVVLARADVPGLVAAHTVVAALPELPLGVVVRRADVDPARAARSVGARSLGVLPPIGAIGRRFRIDRLPRATTRVADGVLVGLADRPTPVHDAGTAPHGYREPVPPLGLAGVPG